MKRTVTALYETREEAEPVAAALKAQGLGDKVQILDAEHDDAKRHRDGLHGWISDVFSGHDHHHLYAEGLRRGHFLLMTRVDEINETRAASLMDAAAVNLGDAEAVWRSEGWGQKTANAAGQAHHHIRQSPVEMASGASPSTSYAATFGGVRAYTL